MPMDNLSVSFDFLPRQSILFVLEKSISEPTSYFDWKLTFTFSKQKKKVEKESK
jgi:hypothetical protein